MLSLRSLFGDEAGVVRERNFQILLLVAVMLPFGNGLVSPILNSLIDPLGGSVGTIGLMISVFWAPSIVLIPVVGLLADRYGRKPILAPSLVLFGLTGAAIAAATSFEIALLLRLLQGIGWAGLSTLIITSIGDLYTGSRETTAQGLRQSGTGVAGAAASVVAGSLVVVAWQHPFLLYLLSLPIAVVVYVWFDEPTTTDETVADGSGGLGYRRGLIDLLRQRRVFAITIARTLPVVSFLGFVTYNSVIVVRLLGGTSVQAGILYGLVSVVYASAASQVGRVTALVGGRYRTLFAANACIGGGLTVVFLAPELIVAVIGVIVVGIGFGVVLPTYNVLITGFAPESLRAGMVSLGSTGSRITGVMTPVVMGGLITSLTPVVGFSTAVQISGLSAAIVGGGGGLICVFIASVAPPVRDGD